MAILLGRVGDAPVPDSPGKWRDGEIVASFPDDHEFCWYEIPHQFLGDFDLSQINAASPTVYQSVRATEAGTVTNGSENVDVAVDDVIVWQNGKFTNFGPRTDFTVRFYQIKITDKLQLEVEAYLQTWNHNPTTTQIDATGDFRTIQTVSDMVSVSGQNAFTQEGATNLLNNLNADYPTANAVQVSLTNDTFVFTLTCPIGARDEIIERINDMVREVQYHRRRWYINEAGRNFLAANNYIVAGPAATVGTYLRDGLLD